MTAAKPIRKKGRSKLQRRLRKAGSMMVFTVITATLCAVFILPFLYTLSQSFSDPQTVATPGAPLYPAIQRSYACTDSKLCTYESGYLDATTGKFVAYGPPVDVSARGDNRLPVYEVPDHGTLALLNYVDPSSGMPSVFIDPATNRRLEAVSNSATWAPVWDAHVTIDNFSTALQWANDVTDAQPGGFARWLVNSGVIAILAAVGAAISAIIVAYGFARFRFPLRNLLFFVLIGTVLIPYQVTLIPQFILYRTLGWTSTFLPLIVPNFFGNAMYIFLLRQYFLTLPRELDEAAQVDGASPFRILVSVIIPQSWPAIIAVAMFQFFFSWNDFMGPLIYLNGQADLYPVALGLNYFSFQLFNGVPNAPLIMETGAVIALIIPVAIFFVAQRAFMRGVVISGVEK
jgi:multiple sugar transport system permease protein